MAHLYSGHERHPASKAERRANTRPDRDPPEFPVRWIPIVVPALAVVLAMVVYFLMGVIL